MLATRSSTETRRCRGECGRLLPLDAENFASAGRKLSGLPKFRSRCKWCMTAERDRYRATLRAAGKPVNRSPIERGQHTGPKLPAKPLGARVRAAIDRESLVSGRPLADVWEAFAARSAIASSGSTAERMVFAWRTGQTKTVVASTAVDALGGVDLLLVDAYEPEVLATLPPVTLD